MMDIYLAIIVGLLFGFALNRVGATNPQNIINMLRLTDLHLMKVIVFAIGVSSLLLFSGMALDIINPAHLSVKDSYWGVLIGGALLGAGFAISGYCPGTGLSAAATGRIDAIVFVLGGLLGAFVYALHYDMFKTAGILDKIFGGKVTLASTGIDDYATLIAFEPGWIVAGILAIILVGAATFLPMHLIKENK